MAKIEELIEELLIASQMYYQEMEDAPLTDEEYDDKIDYLKELTEEIPDLLENKDVIKLLEGSVAAGSSPNVKTNTIVNYKIPMLSLHKANTVDDLKEYTEKIKKAGGTAVRLQCKLDGFAIDAKYEKGNLVRISTRGDGHIGEDISYLMNENNLDIVGLPNKLTKSLDIELRGEVFLRHSQFDKVNKARAKAGHDLYKNPRNGVVGLIKKAKEGIDYKAEITFVVYSPYLNDKYLDLNSPLLSNESIIDINELTITEWRKVGGIGDLTSKNNFNDLFLLVNKFGEKRVNFDCPTDGVVIKPLNEAKLYSKMGATTHHPHAFVAFKYPGEKKHATVLDIELSVGKTGKITPKATLTPTDLDGSIVTKATCHNFNWMYEKNIRIGSEVMVTKANDIIPAIVTVLTVGDEELYPMPIECPICKSMLVGDEFNIPKTLKCTNELCMSRLYFSMRDAVGKQGFDIDGLNNVSLEALCNTGKIKDISSFFDLTVDDLKDLEMGITEKGNIRKFGEIRAKKIIKLLDESKTKTLAYKVLNSLEIPHVGPNSSKRLLSYFGSIEKILNASVEELKKVDGFGDTVVNNIDLYRESILNTYNKLIEHGVIMNNGLIEVEQKGSFAISGKVPDNFKNRDEFVNYMESVGFKFNSSPKKTTDYIFGDKNDTSSKIKKAKQLGIKIISPNDYSSLL